MQTINSDFCFQYNNGNSAKRKEAYTYYDQNNPGDFDVWGYNDTIIVFDTNLLLNTYFLSKSERESFIKFVERNKDRILLTSHVDSEYQDHRLEFVSGYNKKLNELEKDADNVLNSIKDNINGRKILENIGRLKNNHVFKYDFPSEAQRIDALSESLQGLYHSVDDTKNRLLSEIEDFRMDLVVKVAAAKNINEDIFKDDKLLGAVAECRILECLSEEEKTYIKQKYDECLKIFNEKKTDTIGRYKYAFPGCGDRKKEEDKGKCKESDLIIYHEILRYMKDEDKNVVFLTLDLTKGDWVPSNSLNNVFLHYIENEYVMSGHVIYIKSGQDLPLTFTNDIENDTDSDEEHVVDTQIETVNVLSHDTAHEGSSIEIQVNETVDTSPSVTDDIPHKKYRAITEERFMSELQTCSKWAKEFGAGYVGKDYFIYCLLGRKKHFEFCQSRQILDKLTNSNKIKIDKNESNDDILIIVDNDN